MALKISREEWEKGYGDPDGKLKARIADLEAALKPFADAAAIIPADAPVMRVRMSDEMDFSITGADLHRARDALTK